MSCRCGGPQGEGTTKVSSVGQFGAAALATVMVMGVFYGVVTGPGSAPAPRLPPGFGTQGGGGPRPTAPIDGSSGGCDTILSFDFFGLFGFDIPEPGWVWIDPADHFRDASGVAVRRRRRAAGFPRPPGPHGHQPGRVPGPGRARAPVGRR